MAGHEAPRTGYPSDPAEQQWELVEPLLSAVKTGGRLEKHPRRAIVDAILYVVRSGCSWRQLPADVLPWQAVYWHFVQWEQAKVTETCRWCALRSTRSVPCANLSGSYATRRS